MATNETVNETAKGPNDLYGEEGYSAEKNFDIAMGQNIAKGPGTHDITEDTERIPGGMAEFAKDGSGVKITGTPSDIDDSIEALKIKKQKLIEQQKRDKDKDEKRKKQIADAEAKAYKELVANARSIAANLKGKITSTLCPHCSIPDMGHVMGKSFTIGDDVNDPGNHGSVNITPFFFLREIAPSIYSCPRCHMVTHAY